MLSYNISRVIKARGIIRPFAYLSKSGFSVNMASNIKNDALSRVDLAVVEKLCLLLHCSPNDLFQWTPSGEMIDDTEHPLNEIRRNEKALDIAKTLSSIPLKKLDEIEALIEQHIKGK